MQFNVRQGIYIASLLHDIGKFWQRGVSSKKELSESTRSIIDSICPKGKTDDYHTHIHALFTSEFFETFSNIFPGTIESDGDRIKLGSLSARHHKYDLNKYERIIQYADRLSSGQDRRAETNQEENEINYRYKKIPLLNPFDVVYQMRNYDQRSYFPIKRLQPDETIFAQKHVKLDTSRESDYKELWDEFSHEVKQLPTGSFSALSNTLLALLKKYTWCIPSATNDMPDISLFDHLKTTAAIATSLYDSQSVDKFGELPPTFDGLTAENKERMLLLAGDFSGIQKFIYQILSRGAAKTLKSRSYYLNIVQDMVLNKIKNVFEVEDSHILMSSGGRFQVFLPNDQEKLNTVKTFIGHVNKELRREYGDVLYVALGAEPFTPKKLVQNKQNSKGYSEIVEKAYTHIEQDKNRKFASVIDASFFEPGPIAGTKGAQMCHVTGKNLQEHELTLLEPDSDIMISTYVKDQIRLGRKLKDARYVVKVKASGKSEDEFIPLEGLQNDYKEDLIGYRLYKHLDGYTLKKIDHEYDIIALDVLNSTNFTELLQRDQHFSTSFSFYGAAWNPDESEDGTPADFSDIAHDGTNNNLAILRLDVDNLGRLFREGFDRTDDAGNYMGSISRYSNLSEKLNLFFSGYLHHLFAEILEDSSQFDDWFVSGDFKKGEPRQHILPIYAGGDDVFIVCRWDIAPLLAKRIKKDFTIFANQRPEVSISGGASIVDDKYPIHKAAKEGEQAEHKAKTLSSSNDEAKKNAFCLFNQAMSWDDFETAQNYVQTLLKWQDNIQKRTILTFLRNLYNEYDENYHYGRWRWRSAYQLKRIGKANNIEPEMAKLASWLFSGNFNSKELNRIEILPKDQQSSIQRNPELVDLTGLTVKWMQNLTRKQ